MIIIITQNKKYCRTNHQHRTIQLRLAAHERSSYKFLDCVSPVCPWPTCMVLSWILEPWCGMRWWSFRITWPSLRSFFSQYVLSPSLNPLKLEIHLPWNWQKIIHCCWTLSLEQPTSTSICFWTYHLGVPPAAEGRSCKSCFAEDCDS